MTTIGRWSPSRVRKNENKLSVSNVEKNNKKTEKVTTTSSSKSLLGDLSSMSISELKRKKATLAFQAQIAAESYPELKAQYQLYDKAIEKEINKKEAWAAAPTDEKVIKKITTTANSELTLSELKSKKALYKAQMLEAIETYPELETQYQAKINEIDEEIKTKSAQNTNSSSTVNLASLLDLFGSSNNILSLLFAFILKNFSNN